MIATLTITIADYVGPQGTLSVEWVQTDAGRQVYRYTVAEMDGNVLTTGDDLRSGTGDDADHRDMMVALISFLLAAGESYQYHYPAPPPDGYMFNTRTCE